MASCNVVTTRGDSPRHSFSGPSSVCHPEIPLAILFSGTREAAFISALFAAGVVHAITADCREGKIEGCECERSSRTNIVYAGADFVAGCSGNIKYGIAFSERFIDTAEIMDRHRRTERSNDILTMNLHNYRVGRKVSLRLFYFVQLSASSKQQLKEGKEQGCPQPPARGPNVALGQMSSGSQPLS